MPFGNITIQFVVERFDWEQCRTVLQRSSADLEKNVSMCMSFALSRRLDVLSIADT